jgi:two-component system, OmpR family, sensor histidine kinase BaeS
MKYSLRTKLVLSYVMVALVCVSLISALSNVFFEKHFKEYIIENQERKNKEIVSLVSQQYLDNGKWNDNMIEKIGINALEQGMIVKVTDNTGKVIWDAKVHNNGLCQQMIEHMSHNMMSRYPNWKGAYVENPYSITSDFKGVGKVEIGYYGPYYFTDHDLAFINALNRVLIWVGVFSLVFAFLIGVLMARRLSNPITKVTGAARMIANGYFGGRVTETSSTKEISQLTGTINNLAETLEKQEILRKRLTGDVAHELRTPLATLQSHMEAMIDGIWKPDTERLKSCHEEIMRISRMVGDLEKLAKYESENLVLNKTEFDVSELISHIVKNFETDFVNKNITLNFSAVKEIIFADKDKISQVIVNLISNALKYTRETGSVEIEVLNEENTSKIGIRDTGSGISAEDLPLIFERFYRADRSRNRLTGGSGIGLTITKAIVEAHKGKIEVKSEVNKGTEFTVVLPKSID